MRQKRVLIVDDNTDLRALFRAILTFGGYDVVEAENGRAGVSAARATRPDLVLMDIAMPVMDGWEAVRRLKADEDTRTIPVCALSAHVVQPFGAESEATGFDRLLEKPILPRDLLAVVREWIGPPEDALPQAVWAPGDRTAPARVEPRLRGAAAG